LPPPGPVAAAAALERASIERVIEPHFHFAFGILHV
jgi:hypothetical protein